MNHCITAFTKYGAVLAALAGLFLSGCEGGGGGLTNSNPGDNDPELYVAMGDSLTKNDGASFPNYPERLSGMLGKTVINAGSDGESAAGGASRVGSVLSEYKPGFLLILYGVNDIIEGASPADVASSVESIVEQAKDNQTVPVVATYPIPVGDHAAFAGGVKSLNSELRSMAGRQGVAIVDLEGAFGDNATDLFLSDGLHPSDEGTELMASTFANVLM